MNTIKFIKNTKCILNSNFSYVFWRDIKLIRLCHVLIVLASVGLSACKTIEPNRLSAADTAALHFTEVEVRVPESATIGWSALEDEYVQSRGYTVGDPRPLKMPEARVFLAERVSKRLKVILERVIAERPAGTRPVRAVATVTAVIIPSVAQRVIIGGNPIVGADINIVDVRTGAVLTSFNGAMATRYAGRGIGGTLIDAALVSGGMDDLFDRAAYSFADRFIGWLNAN